MRASKEARTHRRWREQEARLIAESMTEHWHPITRPLEVAGLAHSLLGGMHFDVAAVRSCAESLIAEGERLEAERVAFMDWTRTRGYEGCPPGVGLGPENREHEAFIRPSFWPLFHWLGLVQERAGLNYGEGTTSPMGCDVYHGRIKVGRIEAAMSSDSALVFIERMRARGLDPSEAMRGGWPGPLAREWGTVRCEACARGCANCGSPARGEVIAGDDGEWFCSTACHHDHDENSCPLERGFGEVQRRRRRLHGDRCKPCKGRGYVKRHGREPAAANGGAWMIRAGRRLLDTLDGRCPWAPSAAAQPSECQRCWGTGHGYPVVRGPFEDGGRVVFDVQQAECPDCRGTGHSLSGTLPPVEWSAQACRATMDGIEAAGNRSPTAWQRDVAMQWARSMVGPPFHTVLDGLDVPTRPLTYLRHGERAVASGEAPGRADVRVVRADVRVVPRGEHRRPTLGREFADQGRRWAPLSEPANDGSVPDRWMPRWRRGELRHSEQRRERRRSWLIGAGSFETTVYQQGDDGQWHAASPARVEPLGIQLSVSEAQRIYAERLGLTVDQLTEQQTREAIQQAALEAIERRVAPQDNGPRVTGT